MNRQPLPRFIVSVRRAFGYAIWRIPLRQRFPVSLFLLGTLLSLAAGLAPSPIQASRLSIPPRGFDHNGRADLAIGAPHENVGTVIDAGAVNVLYGNSAAGLAATGNQYWNQGATGVLDTAEASDGFGEALAFGDFDGDGYLDLAVGVPYEDVGSVADAGGVQISYGSPSGLSSAGNQFWTQDSPGVGGTPETGDIFGFALAVGDFNGDGCDDLAIGVPYEDAGYTNNGMVNVLYGAPSGLIASSQMLYQGYANVVGTPADNDYFGYALTSGDFDNDGRDDLAIGIPLKDHGATDNGAVVIVYGSSLGLTGVGSTLWSQATANVEGIPDDSDMFGYAVATGDFDGDGYDDLAVGVPYEEDVTVADEGAVNILYGSATGISAAGDQIRNQNSPGIPGDAAQGDHFGWALAAGDFNRDGYDDLAIGIPLKDDGATDNGGVVIMSGSSAGMSSTGNQFWSQNTTGVDGGPEDTDEFGYAVAAGDFNGDGYADLAIGVPLEDIGTTVDAGFVNVLYGSATGLTTTGDQSWSQNSTGMVGTTAEAGDRFGSSLAAPRALPVVYLPTVMR